MHAVRLQVHAADQAEALQPLQIYKTARATQEPWLQMLAGKDTVWLPGKGRWYETRSGVPSLLSMADSPPSETLELRLLLPCPPPPALGLYCSPSLGAGLKGESEPVRQRHGSVS